MDRYRLDRRGARFYLDQLDEDRVTVVRPPGEPPHAFVTLDLGVEDLEIDVFLPLEDGVVTAESLRAVRDVVAVLDVLDARAREVPSAEDHEEHLAYVAIQPTELELHYFATTVNSEWGAWFSRAADGSWEFTGLG